MKKIIILLLPLFSFAQMEYTGISKLIQPSQDINIQINNVCNDCFVYPISRIPLYDSIEQWDIYQNNKFESDALFIWKLQYLNNNYDFVIDPLTLNDNLWPLN